MAEFDQFKDDYSEKVGDSLSFAGQSHDFYMRVKADHLIETIQKNYPTKDEVKFLDVGCGHGLIHQYLKEKAPLKIEISGVDPAESVIDLAKQNNDFASYEINHGVELPYDENSFDVASATCVMHHVPPVDWERFLTEMKRVVKPGGLVCIYEHNPYNPITLHIVNNCELDENAVLLSSPSLKKMMNKSGLTNTRTDYVLFLPFDWPIARMVEKKLTWLPLGAQYATIAKV
jgi:ubiquinone/menaquinone biosynthesis C-methylase UbiE